MDFPREGEVGQEDEGTVGTDEVDRLFPGAAFLEGDPPMLLWRMWALVEIFTTFALGGTYRSVDS